MVITVDQMRAAQSVTGSLPRKGEFEICYTPFLGYVNSQSNACIIVNSRSPCRLSFVNLGLGVNIV